MLSELWRFSSCANKVIPFNEMLSADGTTVERNRRHRFHSEVVVAMSNELGSCDLTISLDAEVEARDELIAYERCQTLVRSMGAEFDAMADDLATIEQVAARTESLLDRWIDIWTHRQRPNKMK